MMASSFQGQQQTDSTSLEEPPSQANSEDTHEKYGLFTLSSPKVGAANPIEYVELPLFDTCETHCPSIVAVHGLSGHWKRTWTAPNGKFWLQDFLPSQLPGARIMSFGYNANSISTKSVSDIEDIAKDLLCYLKDKRQEEGEKERPLILIAHSFGGIVVEKVAERPIQSIQKLAQ